MSEQNENTEPVIENTSEEQVVADKKTEKKKKDSDKPKFDKSANIKRKLESNKARADREKRYTGIVTSVPSGDKVEIVPSEVLYANSGKVKTIYVKLNGIAAPSLERVVYENGTDENQKKRVRYPDEEFAWSSREFLRQNLIGRAVIYRLQSRSPSGTYYGDVWFMEDGELIDIRDEAIANGWVSVAERKGLSDKENDSPFAKEYRRIKELEALAQEQGLGIHCTSRAKAQASIRHVHKHRFGKKDNKSAYDLYEKIKEIPQHGVVESVFSGSTLRIILLDRMDEITVELSGVQSPGRKRNSDTLKPFGQEAKAFTSHYLLNRDVIVYLELMDSNNNFYATVKLKDNPEFDITLELLQNGLAKLVDWSVSKGAYITELQAAQESAREAGLKIWQTAKGSGLDTTEDRDQITGRVVDVVNSGSFRILPQGSTENVFVRISSLQPLYPNVGKNFEDLPSDIQKEREKDAAFSFMATDFARKLLIGKKVSCVEDYSYNDNRYYSVYIKDLNVSLRILEEGWGRITSHNVESDRSPQYQQMVLAYNRASKASRGVHGSINNAQTHFNDLTDFDEVKKTQMFLGFFQRAGRVTAVVENVISASKYIIRIPSENNCKLIFSHEGVFSDKKEKDKSVDPKNRNPFDLYPPTSVGNRGYHYTRANLYQRDVEVIISSVDTYGIFYGKIYSNNKDYSLPLLREGYSKLFNRQAFTMDEYSQYKAAQEEAQNANSGIWKNYDPAVEKKKREERAAQKKQEKVTVIKEFGIFITEIIDGSRFWYQYSAELENLNAFMENVDNEMLEAEEPYSPKNGELVFAKFSADGNYYRTTVNRTRKQEGDVEFSLSFVDYGNVQNSTIQDIRKLDKSKYGFDVLPAQAREGRLAFIRTPKLNEEFGLEAANFFKDLVYENTSLIANGNDRRDNVNILNIGDSSTRINVNAALVVAGLAQVERVREKSRILHQKLAELESETKEMRVNIWAWGDRPDSDEEREEERRNKGLL